MAEIVTGAHSSGSDGRPPTTRTKIAIAAGIGTLIESYDFFLYGVASALVFARVFFPSLGPAAGTVAAFATFAVAYFVRPLGGVVFGYVGDRFGRTTALTWTLLIMGGATVGVGLLPDATAIGPAAPLLLILLRVLQGLAVGGEWGGAVLLATENAPDGKRGIFSAIPQVGPPLGFAMTAATLLITGATMSPEQFLQWGWRIPFLLSIVLIVIGFWVRRTIGESPEYMAAMAKMEAKRVPIVEVFQRHWRQVAISTLAVTPVFVFFYLGSVYLTSYGTANLGLPSQTMLAFGLAGAAGFAAVTVLSAHWSDRVGRKRLIIISAVVAIIWGPLLFPVVDNGGELGVAIGVVLTMSAVGIGYGSLAALLAEMFPAEYRYTGVGLVYNLGGVLGGSMTPLVAAALAASFGSVSIGIVVALVGLVAVVAALALRDQPQVAAGAAAPSEIG